MSVTGAVRMIAIAILAAMPLRAQTTGGALIGRITDDERKAITGVEVTATHVATGWSRTIRTATDGRYRFPSVPTGTYAVLAEMKGYTTISVRKVDVLLGVARHIDIRMRRVEEDEELTITAPVRIVESGPAINLIVRRDLIEAVPLRRRDMHELATLAPLTDPRLEDPAAETIADGATEPGDLPLDAIDELNATTFQYPTEYGRTSGGVLLVASRRGTNTLEGDAFTHYRARDETWQWGAAAGGPIDKDVAHAFAAVDRDPFRHDRFFVMADGDISSRHFVESRYSNRSDNVAVRDLWLARDHLWNEAVVRIDSDANEVREWLSGAVATDVVRHDWTAGASYLENHGTAYFVQDSFVFRKLVFNAGIRYDSDLGFSPRAGWAYDVNGSGRNILRGSFGRYRSPDSNNGSIGYSWQVNPWVALNFDALHANRHDAIAVSGQVMFSTFISLAGSYTYSDRVLANDDARHSATIAGTVHLPAAFWLSAIGRYRSASTAGGRFAGTDVRVARTFDFDRGYTIDALLDLFDVFGQGGQPPTRRATQLGLRVNF